MDTHDEKQTVADQPHEDGSISFVLTVAPVSQQAVGKRKAALREIIRTKIKKYRFYYSGEVAVHITWFGREDRRYETDADPDVDNIVKPILDALSGVEDVLFDDCQVQHVSCSWIDTNGIDHLEIKIECPLHDYLPKGHLVFVKFSPSLCYPLAISKNMNTENILLLLSSVESSIAARNTIREKEGYRASQGVMPIQMLFHITRINSFDVVNYEAIEPYLDAHFAKESS